MSKKIFKKSKWYHKYFGLFGVLFLIEMSVSGILLNHKDCITHFDMPHILTPSNYDIKNFNRSAIIDLIETDKYTFIAGKKGVYRKTKKTEFEPIFNGMSKYTIARKTRDIEIVQNDIYAATENGLYYMNIDSDTWKRMSIRDKIIKKIIKKDEKTLFIFSNSNIYLLNIENLSITKITPKKEGMRIVTAIELFFHLHDGRVWGLIGKLLFDLMGIAIIFLSISAFYIWFMPKRIRKRNGNLVKNRKRFRFFYTYHKKIGVYTVALVLIISFTGIFMRPPFIIAITDSFLPRWIYPASIPKNRWHERIENALYDKSRNKIMIQTSEYLWEWNIKDDNFTNIATRSKEKWPLFIMGATYLEVNEKNNYVMGSFSGLYEFNPKTNTYKPLIVKPVGEGSHALPPYSRIKPQKHFMVAGAFKYKAEFYIATHLEGLKNLKGKKVKLFEQPKIMNEIKMPVWNWMFELHNGRILKFIIGKYYILLVPFSALLFFFVILSGLYDWIFIRRKKNVKNKI